MRARTAKTVAPFDEGFGALVVLGSVSAINVAKQTGPPRRTRPKQSRKSS